MKANDLLLAGAAIVGLYLLSRGSEAVDKAADALANWWIGVTTDPVNLLPQIVLPDKRVISANAIVGDNWIGADDKIHFNFEGVRYRLTGERHENLYQAVKV